MFDLAKTIDIIKGGLLDPEPTWRSFLDENHNWQETAALLTAPLIILTAFGAWIIRLIFGGGMMMGGATTVGAFLISTIFALLGFALFAFVLAFLSGVFNGKNDFNKSFAGLSLASIPNYLGTLIASLPLSFISPLISLAASIYSLVLLYRIIPLCLSVPEDKRVVHFVVSLVAVVLISFVLVFLIGSILGVGMMTPRMN